MSRVLSGESIRSLAFATAVTLLVTGCILGGETQDEHVVFEGRVYVARGSGPEVPLEQLTVIGTTTEVMSSEPIDHADVYAVEGIDSDLVVAAVIFPVGYEELAAGTPPAEKPDVDYFHPFARLYLRQGEASYPEAACAYFDPSAQGVHGGLAPEECR